MDNVKYAQFQAVQDARLGTRTFAKNVLITTRLLSKDNACVQTLNLLISRQKLVSILLKMSQFAMYWDVEDVLMVTQTSASNVLMDSMQSSIAKDNALVIGLIRR